VTFVELLKHTYDQVTSFVIELNYSNHLLVSTLSRSLLNYHVYRCDQNSYPFYSNVHPIKIAVSERLAYSFNEASFGLERRRIFTY
jgi:hypothetical protein